MAKSPKDPKAISEAKDSIPRHLNASKTGANREFDILIFDEIIYCIAKGLTRSRN